VDADAGFDAIGCSLKHGIAGAVAERGVDLLEAVEIKHQHRNRRSIFQRGVEAFTYAEPVGKVGEARRRSLMSRVTLAKPISLPFSSRMVSTTTLAQKCVPSFRTRTPSASKRPSRAAVSKMCLGSPPARSSGVKKRLKCCPTMRRVALEALRAGIPVRHDPIGIEHVNGVVGDAFDEKLEAALAGGQILLGLRGGRGGIRGERRPARGVRPRHPRSSTALRLRFG
jgi:hypothetical protein